jgi:hypothetical protein
MKDNDFIEIGQYVGEIVTAKNRAYGDSFAKSGAFLRLLYPNGIAPNQYDDALALVRVFDKQMRIATANDPGGENPWMDIMGYALLSVKYRMDQKGDNGNK